MTIARKLGLSMAASLALVSAGPGALAADAAPRCLRANDVKYTNSPDNKSLFFVMKNGSTYRSDLPSVCQGLSLGGFAYDADSSGLVCGGQQTIRALQSHEICWLGPFSLVTPDAR
jgi:hypothetical protein